MTTPDLTEPEQEQVNEMKREVDKALDKLKMAERSPNFTQEEVEQFDAEYRRLVDAYKKRFR